MSRWNREYLRWLTRQGVLRDPVVSCALIGASSPQQIVSAVEALALPPLEEALQQQILAVLA